MSEVFYRKWRPRRLDQVVGQEPITQTLRNAVVLGRVAHAYLFCGPRGTGKTSTARILAKAVNCLTPQEGEPDNHCGICTSMNESRALDLIEIDAASNRGIDDIRDLRDKVHFSPNEARYKVYIIDEAHMLTEHAFNALLKTLEEPPEHAIFILATTESHKIPLTIISRCQRFDFRRIPLDVISMRLMELCRDESVQVDQEALTLISRISTGSLRDAENLLERAVVSYGSPLKEDQVRDLLELGGEQKALELAGHVVTKSVQAGLMVINQVSGEGADIRQFHRSLVTYLRSMFLLKSGAEVPSGFSDETNLQMKSLTEQTSISHLLRALKIFSDVDISRDGMLSLPLELALVESSIEGEKETEHPAEMLVGTTNSTEEAVPPLNSMVRTLSDTTSISSLPIDKASIAHEDQLGDTELIGSGKTSGGKDVYKSTSNEKIKPSDKQTNEVSGLQHVLDSNWDSIINELRTRKGKRFNLSALLRVSTDRKASDHTITLSYSHPSHQQRMQEELDDPNTAKMLKETFALAMGHPFEIRVVVADGMENGPARTAAQRSRLVRTAQAMGAKVLDEKEEENGK